MLARGERRKGKRDKRRRAYTLPSINIHSHCQVIRTTGDVNHPITHSATRNKASQSSPPHGSEAAFTQRNITSSQQRTDSALARCGISPTYTLTLPRKRPSLPRHIQPHSPRSPRKRPTPSKLKYRFDVWSIVRQQSFWLIQVPFLHGEIFLQSRVRILVKTSNALTQCFDICPFKALSEPKNLFLKSLPFRPPFDESLHIRHPQDSLHFDFQDCPSLLSQYPGPQCVLGQYH